MPFIDQRGEAVAPPESITIEIDQFADTPALDATALTLPFESGVDGRAFSAAALYRAEGFEGQLIGTGDIGIDRLAYGFRSGFDLLWITDEELELLSPLHLTPFPDHYQLAVGG